MAEPQPISVAVLAGGQSRRMGTDKASLDWGSGTLIEHVISRVRDASPSVDDVRIIGDRGSYHRFGVPVHSDRFVGAGTLGGIATAISVADHEHVFVIACDMPLLVPALLRAMIEQPRAYDVLVPALSAERSDQGGKQTFETLHAVYHKTCLPAIESRIEAGQLKVIGFFDQVNVRTIDEDWVRWFDPDLHSFMNVNTPEQLSYARQLTGVASDGSTRGRRT